MTDTWIAIDGGQSAVRVRRSWAHEVTTGPGYRHGPGRGGELASVEALLDTLAGPLSSARAERRIDVVAAGLTGMPADPARARSLAQGMVELSGAREVRLCGDAVTAHLGALEGSPGVVASVGTGVVVLAVTQQALVRQIDGCGYLFGDAGGAFAIGRRGITAALRDKDGRESAPRLAAAVAAHFGAPPELAARRLYDDPDLVNLIAGFAPEVLALAAEDPAAAAIMSGAAADLVDTITAAATSFPPDHRVDYSLIGGLITHHHRFLAAVSSGIEARLAASARLVAPAGNPLDGAARLALAIPDLHSTFVHRYGV